MRPSLWPPTLAAIPLAFGIAWLAHWLLLLLGWRIRAADHIAYVVLSVAVPVIWIALVAGTEVRRARRTGAATTFGSARWMDRRSVRRMTRGSGLIIGRENRRGGRLLRYGGPAHLITIAPTRTGKGVGTIIPNLLAVGRSMLVVDPKGENAAATWYARSLFGPLHVLDPFGITGRPSAACNPLDRIDAAAPDAAEDAALLADALITDPPHQVVEAHWNEEAKALLVGLILFVAAEEASSRKSLATVRDLLTLPIDRFERLLVAMQDSKAAGGLVARAAQPPTPVSG